MRVQISVDKSAGKYLACKGLVLGCCGVWVSFLCENILVFPLMLHQTFISFLG